MSEKTSQERRRNKRRPILESFSLFVVIPKKGGHKLPVHDVSERGLLFDLDTEGESAELFPIESGETIELNLYINQLLYLPMVVQVRRIDAANGLRRIGAEIVEQKAGGQAGLNAFVQFLDAVLDSARVKS